MICSLYFIHSLCKPNLFRYFTDDVIFSSCSTDHFVCSSFFLDIRFFSLDFWLYPPIYVNKKYFLFICMTKCRTIDRFGEYKRGLCKRCIYKWSLLHISSMHLRRQYNIYDIVECMFAQVFSLINR